jgi:hypothetical protein
MSIQLPSWTLLFQIAILEDNEKGPLANARIQLVLDCILSGTVKVLRVQDPSKSVSMQQ